MEICVEFNSGKIVNFVNKFLEKGYIFKKQFSISYHKRRVRQGQERYRSSEGRDRRRR